MKIFTKNESPSKISSCSKQQRMVLKYNQEQVVIYSKNQEIPEQVLKINQLI